MVAALPGHVDLNRLAVFVGVVESGGFTAATDRLGIAKGRVSEQISQLERETSTALFIRTTRKVVLTDAGRTLYDACLPLLNELQTVVSRAGDAGAQLQGVLRVTTTVDHAATFLAPALAKFSRLHPLLAVELRASDAVLNLIEERIDVAIRGGDLPDSRLKATHLGSFEPCLVASPSYLAQRGIPAKPADLQQHDAIALTMVRAALTLNLTGARGQAVSVRLQARIRVDSIPTLRAFAEAGAGVCALDQFSAAASLRSGTLVRVLPRWSMARRAIHAVYPDSRQIPAKTRAFIDFYRAYLGNAMNPRATA